MEDDVQNPLQPFEYVVMPFGLINAFFFPTCDE
jgi:hypothetical protein